MLKKTLLASVISYIVLFVADISIYSRELSFDFFALSFFYGIPVVGVIFGCLLLLNAVLKPLFSNKSKKTKNNYYFLTGFVIVFVPTMGFILFDYYNGGASGYKASFLYIFLNYLIIFPLAATILLLNRRIVWKNFESDEPAA